MKSNKSQLRKRFEREALPHLGELYGMALKLTHHDRDAEDLVQDTMVRAFRAFDQYEAGTNIRAWLFRILTNTFYNLRRKEKNLQRISAESEPHMNRYMALGTQTDEGVEDTLIATLTVERLQEAMTQLPEEFVVPVVLCDLYEFTYREIADILNCPVGTVMSRIHRGRRLIRNCVLNTSAKTQSSDETLDLNQYRAKRSTSSV